MWNFNVYDLGVLGFLGFLVFMVGREFFRKKENISNFTEEIPSYEPYEDYTEYLNREADLLHLWSKDVEY